MKFTNNKYIEVVSSSYDIILFIIEFLFVNHKIKSNY